jgi:hypothetical protein
MWVPEYFVTLAYVINHPETRRCDTAWDNPRNKPAGFAPARLARLPISTRTWWAKVPSKPIRGFIPPVRRTPHRRFLMG